MSEKLVGAILGGVVIGLIALALDYFLLQHIFKTPISMAGGIGVVPVLIYLIVPFLVLLVGGRNSGTK
jgi:hypothetical protein